MLIPVCQCQQLIQSPALRRKLTPPVLEDHSSTVHKQTVTYGKKGEKKHRCSLYFPQTLMRFPFFLFCLHSTGFSRLFIRGKWLSVCSRYLSYLQELAQTSHIFGLGLIKTFALYTLAPLKTCQKHPSGPAICHLFCSASEAGLLVSSAL